MGLFSLFKKKEPAAETLRDRRMLPRWQINARAKIRFEGVNDYLDCEVRNLNMKGFSLSLVQEIPLNCTQVTLYFSEEFFFTVDIAIENHKQSDDRNIYWAKFTKVRDNDREKMFRMMRRNFPQYLEKI